MYTARAMILRSAALAACLAAALLASACAPPEATTRRATIFSSAVVLSLYDHATDDAFEACFARLREIDAKMNMWDPESELGRLNARAGRGPAAASRDILNAAAQGLELARATDGIFDLSVAPLVRLWGVGTPRARLPSEAEIRAALRLVDWRRVELDEKAGTIALGSGMGMDFGALAKGYGAAEGGALLASLGVKSAILDVGGCVLAIGSAPGGAAWKIGVQDPGSARGTPLGYFAGREFAVDTSGVYERYFESGGRRYAHIMDTRTGRPVEGHLSSASIAVPRGQNSDGPPLALLVLGPEAGLALANRLGLAAVLIGSDKRVYRSAAARGSFTLLDKAYTFSDTP
jgi:thiamine biosynthesis lipoprotein